MAARTRIWDWVSRNFKNLVRRIINETHANSAKKARVESSIILPLFSPNRSDEYSRLNTHKHNNRAMIVDSVIVFSSKIRNIDVTKSGINAK